MDTNGHVTFNIQRSPLIGAPDNYVDTFNLFKENNPEGYARYSALKQEALQTNDQEKLLAAFQNFK